MTHGPNLVSFFNNPYILYFLQINLEEMLKLFCRTDANLHKGGFKETFMYIQPVSGNLKLEIAWL